MGQVRQADANWSGDLLAGGGSVGERFADLFSRYIWQPMGAEFDANITVDEGGAVLARVPGAAEGQAIGVGCVADALAHEAAGARRHQPELGLDGDLAARHEIRAGRKDFEQRRQD